MIEEHQCRPVRSRSYADFVRFAGPDEQPRIRACTSASDDAQNLRAGRLGQRAELFYFCVRLGRIATGTARQLDAHEQGTLGVRCDRLAAGTGIDVCCFEGG